MQELVFAKQILIINAIVTSLAMQTNTLLEECEEPCSPHIFYFHIFIYLIENIKWEHWEFQYHRGRPVLPLILEIFASTGRLRRPLCCREMQSFV